MSEKMKHAREIVEKIIVEVESGNTPNKEDLLVRLNDIDKLIARNQSKIWLRTRSGKPMAENLEKTARRALESHELNELEVVVKEIDAESEKRSMIVT